MSEIKVLVSDNFAFASDSVAIAILLVHGTDDRRIMQISPEGYHTWERVDPLAATRPTFTLPNDIGRAVLEQLLRHYQGAEDMHTVRGDLLHERGRVDRLITMYGDLADKVAENL